MSIRKTAVLGAGRMGSAIAAHMANAGVPVVLLDVVPPDAGNRRNRLAEEAVERMTQSERSPLTYPGHADRIICGNFEDDMDMLGECDWIVEAVVEDAAVKKDLLRRVDHARKRGSIVSSNTSTLPLRKLKEGQSNDMKSDLVITHFFNPSRQMGLLEFVSGQILEGENDRKKRLLEFADIRLGKTVVEARDTPGFIGNRLGLYWMLTGLQQALERNIPVAMADAVMGKKLGFPSTGIFGLFDLVGVRLMRDLGHSLRAQLPQDDSYQALGRAMDFLDAMSRERFYLKENSRVLSLNLATGAYEEPPDFAVDDDLSLAGILVKDNQAAHYARDVLLRTLNYACDSLPEIAESVADADIVMRLGFNWRAGPFEMIDALGNGKPGSSVLIDALEEAGLTPAQFLQRARSGPFYHTHKGKLFHLIARDGYKPNEVAADKWEIADIARGTEPLLANKAARLWDIGDGVCCLEAVSKMGTISHETFDLIEEAMAVVARSYKGLIVGHDAPHFSAGLDLRLLLKACENRNWDWISALVRDGQKTMMHLKKAPFPIVGAPSGKALGGGCEMLLHCDGIQAHIESQIGLVEVRIGLVPAWGGCKELLIRHLRNVHSGDALLACGRIFDDLARAQVSASAEQARDQLYFKSRLGITMNRGRLLADAKKLCLTLTRNYLPPGKESIKIPAGAAALFSEKIAAMARPDDHDKLVLEHLATVLSGGGAQDLEEGELLNLEHDAFMALVKTRGSQEKIAKVL